ncbi:MAG: hypothetical protein GY937_12690 [bacterium]|nr:hypothetical protein [bacterium]
MIEFLAIVVANSLVWSGVLGAASAGILCAFRRRPSITLSVVSTVAIWLVAEFLMYPAIVQMDATILVGNPEIAELLGRGPIPVGQLLSPGLMNLAELALACCACMLARAGIARTYEAG